MVNTLINAFLCRYNEIAIKGNNRCRFEGRLVDNIRSFAAGVDGLKISRIRGRVWISKKGGGVFSQSEEAVVLGALSRTFGVESFSPGIMRPPDMEEICGAVAATAPAEVAKVLSRAADGHVPSFRVRARRSDKNFPLTSREIEMRLAAIVAADTTPGQLRVDLGAAADLTLGCEVRDEFAFAHYRSLRGPGGLPVGCNDPGLVLLSGGIDSPVAAYMTMKRGCALDFLTFHSEPYTPPETVDKVREIVVILNQYQRPPGRLYACNLAPFQKVVRDKCLERYRTVLYRRAMFRIAALLARSSRRRFLVTGEAIGQVASQTIANLDTINAATDMLVVRPLVGMDKQETTEIARRIGSFDTSARQVPDSCTVFAPASPSTNTPVNRAKAEEAKIPGYDELIQEIAEFIEIV